MSRKMAESRWRQVLDEQAASGLAVAEFCRRGELNTSSFYRWRKKLGKAGPTGRFVPVSVVEDLNRPPGDAAVEVEFPCDVVMRVPIDDPRSLGQMVSLLIDRSEQRS
jgi:hypothetical protein